VILYNELYGLIEAGLIVPKAEVPESGHQHPVNDSVHNAMAQIAAPD
jgi:hypothetical protein